MKKITVLIVDDSALIRTMFKEMLSSEPDIEVLDTAVDPYYSREKIKALNPQVLTLDIEMPKMDGLSFLEKIMTLRPMPVIMASTLTQKGAEATIRALELGAVDYISKPTGGHGEAVLAHLKEELVTKVRAAAQVNMSGRANNADTHKIIPFTPSRQPHLIAIGSSTGGVEALRDIFMMLPENCPPIIMTQHMPEHFTTSFAARLSTLSKVKVREAEDGMLLMPGHACLAPGGKRHLKVVKAGTAYKCQLVEAPPVSGHCPSVDVLFHSVAEAGGKQAVGVILTGMGKDGAAGMLNMREHGAYNIGQNQSTCVVYGMPKAARTIGAVHVELPLRDIAAQMLSYCEQEKETAHAV